jgi:hypothetical protein
MYKQLFNLLVEGLNPLSKAALAAGRTFKNAERGVYGNKNGKGRMKLTDPNLGQAVRSLSGKEKAWKSARKTLLTALERTGARRPRTAGKDRYGQRFTHTGDSKSAVKPNESAPTKPHWQQKAASDAFKAGETDLSKFNKKRHQGISEGSMGLRRLNRKPAPSKIVGEINTTLKKAQHNSGTREVKNLTDTEFEKANDKRVAANRIAKIIQKYPSTYKKGLAKLDDGNRRGVSRKLENDDWES